MSAAILTKHATSAARGDDLLNAYAEQTGENVAVVEDAVVDAASDLMHFAIAELGPDALSNLLMRLEVHLHEEWTDHLAGDPDPNLEVC